MSDPAYLPADIGLCAPNGPGDVLGHLIEAGETVSGNVSTWACHVWLADSFNTLVEALAHVVSNPIAKYTGPAPAAPCLVLRIKSLHPQTRQYAATVARGMLADDYGVLDIVADLGDKILSFFRRKDVVFFRKVAPSINTRDCSVLVARALDQAAGWRFCGCPPQAVEPATIYADYCQRPETYTVIYCSEGLRGFLR